jgi:hypothetical protein
MEQLMNICDKIGEFVKPMLIFVISAILSVLLPVKDVLVILLGAAFFNWFIGLITDIHVNHAKYSNKKSFEAITQLLLYGGLVMFVRFAFFMQGDGTTGDLIVKYITYIVIYFYTANILKNSKDIYPKSKAIELMYQIVTTEIYKELKNRLKIKKDETE